MDSLPQFRESVERALYVSGEINSELVYRLTPEIDRLRSDAGDPPRPITVFIDSPGGEISSATAISRLLQQERIGFPPPQIITVVRNYAASAAADLLARGDYSIAYPGATVHYHGTRLFSAEVTRERAEMLLESLNRQNDQFALRLARKVFNRFVFLFGNLRSSFEEARKQIQNPRKRSAPTDLECFAALLHEKLNVQPAKVVKSAFGRRERVRQLVEHVIKYAHPRDDAPIRDMEVHVFKAILGFELRRNRQPEWCLSRGGLGDLVSDFLLLHDYLTGAHRSFRESLVIRLGPMLLPGSLLGEFQTVRSSGDGSAQLLFLEQHVGHTVDDLWYFTLSLCRFLQQDEYPLTAVDAYWLGIVDEVAGEKLPNLRVLLENQPQT